MLISVVECVTYAGLTGVVVGHVGYRVGTVHGQKAERKRKAIKEPKYKCLCEHNVTLHERIEYWEGDILMVKYGKCNVVCSCSGYVGNVPPDPGSVPSADKRPTDELKTQLVTDKVVEIIRQWDDPTATH